MMSQRQRDALRYITARLTEAGRIPTTREIKRELGIKSMSTAHRLRHGLIARGIVTNGEPPTVNAVAFKGFRFDPQSGLERVF